MLYNSQKKQIKERVQLQSSFYWWSMPEEKVRIIIPNTGHIQQMNNVHDTKPTNLEKCPTQPSTLKLDQKDRCDKHKKRTILSGLNHLKLIEQE